jgi:RNA polymerase sigma-70 factor (ECF subfamily)
VTAVAKGQDQDQVQDRSQDHRQGEDQVQDEADRSIGPGDQDPVDWIAALALPGPQQDHALGRLHALMLRAARHQVRRMRGMLHGAGETTLEELAHSAADEAMAVLLTKLHTFQGRSRFTTWAYKFAILQAATEVRRRSWADREVSLDDAPVVWDSAPGPEQHAEAADLARAVATAMQVALTPYQRRIATALVIDQVPIDVLAGRLGTTRGALYKALHQARGRLRAQLCETGHLTAVTPPEGDR